MTTARALDALDWAVVELEAAVGAHEAHRLLVERALQIIRREEPSAASVLEQVAQAHRVTLKELRSPSRASRLVAARDEAARRLRDIKRPDGRPRLTLQQIGAALGGRDHTTIKHSLEKGR